MLFRTRSYELELIDIGDTQYSQDEYTHCLYQLGRIGRLMLSDRLTIQALRRLHEPINSILDVGCGGGSFTERLAQEYPNAKVVGIDISKHAIAYAQRKMSREKSNLSFAVPATPELNEPYKSYDIVTSTLVCHHLDNPTIIDFLQRAAKVARKAIVINDLHRHWLAYAGFSVIAPLFFRNRLIMHDGLLSIKRAFTRDDWRIFLEQAGFKPSQYTIRWGLAFRWIVTIDTKDMV